MRLKNLEQYKVGGSGDRMDLSMPLPKTPDDRVYRYSPNEAAPPRLFVLGNRVEEVEATPEMRRRMKQMPGQPRTVCPYSGVIAEDGAFLHPKDRQAALDLAQHAFVNDVSDMLKDAFADINRSQPRNSMFRMEVKVTSKPHPKPQFFREDLLRELVCDHCGRDYGVFAVALYCPDCGAPNVSLHFAREIELVARQIEIAEAQDNKELAYRLLGNAHEDVLTGFEAILKTVYIHGKSRLQPGEEVRVGNDFQNVDRGRARYQELGIDPFSELDEVELATLRLNIQKRHVIGHNLGVIDAKFVEHAGDAAIGETVQLVGADIHEFGRLSYKVVDRLDTWLGTSNSQVAPAALPEPPGPFEIDPFQDPSAR